MTATVIDGKKIAHALRERLKQEVAELAAHHVQPGLAVILVGEDPASHSYVRGKEKACESLGIYSKVYRLPASVSEAELLHTIHELNESSLIHGILVQLPLPSHISESSILLAISPDKDVDGFHLMNVGKLQTGLPTFLPCTPHGVIQLLQYENIPIEGKHAVIVGRSNIVGKPLAALLLQHNATVTICHSKTVHLKNFTKQADILIAAVGKLRMITADMVKSGAAVIDVGINRVNGRLVGDVDFEEVRHVASAITPVPGGVGPMTIAMLLYNTVEAAKRLES
ncbi:bifunctional methylenetetrahydrofolate dehydrogenase/methenyltetrahydrofolate cyclohydrolase FolD [Fodinisporobacter ferrooxydans]|uniref:Bifunctional protein FolD n=1 Tax=Fodinisporobacter ferrooxydans TaxID=2901836 RepID=A0ABY4CQI4_9BACL|nr:bifunctional methylenetetrahydrofolate dehydrogenase/methenyltetrahydrofolate cyclohydrolase FolD [Alicyclobacillaceae bacterium MYW30-H2]